MKLRKRSEAGGAEPTRVGSAGDLERDEHGRINNCALANGAEEASCQMCLGVCPDKKKKDRDQRIADTSAAINEEIRKAGEEERDAEHERRRIEFRSVQKRKSALRPDLSKIVETHWTEDLYKDWNRVRAALRVGEQRSEHGHVMLALDEARKIAEDAYGLMVTAKLEAKRWEAANEVVFGAMWMQARVEAERERKAMGFSKAVTDQDVRAKCAVLFPDEWLAQEHEREKVKLTVDRMTNLAKIAADKAEDVRAMLKGQRG